MDKTERIEVSEFEDENYTVRTAFEGCRLVEGMYTMEPGWPYTRWCVAVGKNEGIAIWAFDQFDRVMHLKTYASFEDAVKASNSAPGDVLSVAAHVLGRSYVKEIDL